MPKRTSGQEIARFLRHLSETGNFALACDRIDRGKAGLYKRRATDPIFAQQCDAAIAVARAHLTAEKAKAAARLTAKQTYAAPRRYPHPNARLRTRPGDVELSVAPARAPQLRRTAAGRLTPTGVDAFLTALAATANVRLAAASIGVAPSSIYARYRRHAAFREAMDEALAFGCDRLELAMMRCAVDGRAPTPDPYAPADGTPSPNSGFTPPEPTIVEMTADDALRLLTRHRRDPNAPRRHRPSFEELAPSIRRKIEAVARLSDEEAKRRATAYRASRD